MPDQLSNVVTSPGPLENVGNMVFDIIEGVNKFMIVSKLQDAGRRNDGFQTKRPAINTSNNKRTCKVVIFHLNLF